MGFAKHRANSDTEVHVSPLRPYPQRGLGTLRGACSPALETIGLEAYTKTNPVTPLPSPLDQDLQRRTRLGEQRET